MTTKRERLLRSTILAGVASAVAFTGFAPAFAQDEEERETIVVTGSRIERSDFTAVSPITVISAQEIDTAGTLQLGEILRNQLAVGTDGFNSSSVLSGGGAQSISLRNLGPDRTLTLINGRRVANFADGLQNEAQDLGLLPIAAIESIEILRDGASAVYGADAVAGVVNIILRDDFEGLELSGQAGISGEGDRETFSVQATLGGNFDRGNIVISGEYNYSDLVPQVDRDWAFPSISSLSESDTGGSIGNGSFFHPGGITFFDDGGLFCTTPIAFGGDEITNTINSSCPNNFGLYDPDFTPGSRYDYALQQSILSGQEQIALTAFGTYDITNNMQAFLEFQLTDRETETNLDGNPVSFTSGNTAYSSGWRVAANNPYNPNPGVAANLLIRPTSTVGTRASRTNAQNLRLAAGLTGTLFDRFNWEASYLHTQVTSSGVTNAVYNLRRAITISDPDLCAQDPNCVNALQPGSLGALDAYRPGNWSDSEIEYFRQITRTNFDQELNSFQAFIGGPLFELPAGSLSALVGVEYREESLVFRPDSVTEAGESVANQTNSTFGGFDTYEVFGEVDIPILSGQPFAESLFVNVQGRLFDYSTFGQDSVWKASLNWTPVEDVRFRATYGTSFRQPTLVDVFSGGTVSFDFLTDPCSVNGLSGASAERIANCASTGPLGVGTVPGFDQAAAQIAVLAGGDAADGNFDLGPEEGESWTIGLVLQPRFVPNLRASVDYYDITVEDSISTTDLQNDILNQCFDSAGFSDTFACSRIARDPFSRQLIDLVRTPVNEPDTFITRGVDWTVDYFFDVANLFGGQGDWGTISLGHQGSFMTERTQGTEPGFSSGSSGFALPEYRLNFQAEWAISDYTAEVRARYIPEMDGIQPNGQPWTGANPLGYTGPDDILEFDLRFGADVTPSTAVLFGINNVTDEEPPYVFNTGNNTSPGLYSSAVVGRYFFGRVTQTF